MSGWQDAEDQADAAKGDNNSLLYIVAGASTLFWVLVITGTILFLLSLRG